MRDDVGNETVIGMPVDVGMTAGAGAGVGAGAGAGVGAGAELPPPGAVAASGMRAVLRPGGFVPSANETPGVP